MDIKKFQETVLKGQEIPKDLAMLIKNKCAMTILESDFFELLSAETIAKELAHSLSEEDKNDSAVMANCKAINLVFEKITFFATIESRHGSHTLIGYWQENDSVLLSEAPLVAYSEFSVLNGDRSFRLLYDDNIIESLVAELTCEDEDEYEAYKKSFSNCGVQLKEVWDLESKIPTVSPEELHAQLHKTDKNEAYPLDLSLDFKKLKEIPKSVLDNLDLEVLSLSENKITEIPDFISKLKHLKSIYLDNNEITEIPKFFENFEHLENLYLHNNNIKELNLDFSKMKSLKKITLDFVFDIDERITIKTFK